MSADRVSRAANAAEQLCTVLWEAVHEELDAGRPLQVARLTDRLAEVCASVSAIAHAGGGSPDRPAAAGGASGAGGPEGASQPPPGSDRAEGGSPRHDPLRQAPEGRRGARSARVEGRPAILIDEHEGAEAGRGDVEAHRNGPATSIEIRDVRGLERNAWIEAIQRRLDRHAEDRERFAVLLIEVLDADRLRLAQAPADSYRQLRDVESAIVEQLRPADALLRESDGRYWLIAPQTDEGSARVLAERIANAVRRSASHRVAPLDVAAGIAVCPEHGLDASSLAGHADVDLYAAQSSGRSVSDRGDHLPPI